MGKMSLIAYATKIQAFWPPKLLQFQPSGRHLPAGRGGFARPPGRKVMLLLSGGWATATDTGLVRDQNEDSVAPRDMGMETGRFVVGVADGAATLSRSPG